MKIVIVMWGCFGGVSGVLGVLRGVTSDMTVPCLLAVYYPNYTEIKGNSHLFLKNRKWLSYTSHNIYPMMHLGVDLLADLGVDLPIAILDH